MYPYGLIGNCQASALIDNTGSLNWLCMPRPDSPPVFGKILDDNGGHFSIRSTRPFSSTQNYLANTNILVTTVTCADGSAFKITDFCPRFEQHGRIYRPNSLFRIVEPVQGTPTIKVSCCPVSGWDKNFVSPIRGNSHLKFEIRGEFLRVATNMSLTYLIEESEFTLQEKIVFGLTWGTGIEDDFERVTQQFLDNTAQYWRTWVKHCSIPTLFQKETIRSALTLKMHCYEDTGAILAALTTSLPEEVGNCRNWDYRYCWLRDAAFVVSALHSLGHFEEMEGFLKFLLSLALKHDRSLDRLHPVYALDQQLPLPEVEFGNWVGFGGSKPVRSNNQAAEHIQNDVYGELVLALAPIFFDERFCHLRTREHESLLQNLVELCIANISKPDAGLWEIRNGWQVHSFANLMCWAGIERAIRIKEKGYLSSLELSKLETALKTAEDSLQKATQDGALRNGPSDSSLDAALLLLPILRYPDSKLCANTVTAILDNLSLKEVQKGFLYRYLRPDDFGEPKSAFLICSFWLVQALALTGRKNLAEETLSTSSQAANRLGLFAEHFDPASGKQSGNFPQAYSHVGLINAAFAISPPWGDVL